MNPVYRDRARACSVVTLLLGSAVVACADDDGEPPTADTSICGDASEGIFLVDLATRDLIQLAGYDNRSGTLNQIKYSFLEGSDGEFDFAFVPDLSGDLYHFTARLDEAMETSMSEPKLVATDASKLNGPAYCSQQRVLSFGNAQATSVDVELVGAGELRTLERSTVAEARSEGFVTTLLAEPLHIAADLNCGDPLGVAFTSLDCIDSDSVGSCIASGENLATIGHRQFDDPEVTKLSSPESDPLIAASPGRPPGNPLGDADPDVWIDDAGTHLMFERVHTTPEVFDNPDLASEFRTTGFSDLVYTRPGDATGEYRLDFSRALPAEHQLLVFPHMSASGRPGVLRFSAMGVFKTPNRTSGMDEDIFTGLFIGEFDTNALPEDPSQGISIEPSSLQQVLSFADFVCGVWDSCGMDLGGAVYLYALYSPKFIDSPDGREYLAFSTSKNQLGSVSNGIVTFPDGRTQSADDLRATICGPRE